LIGGVLWQRSSHLPLEAACAVSSVGVMVFVAMSILNIGRR
jgi:hypothetical protein